MKYSIVIEKSANGYGAYVPDLPGCAVVADTAEQTRTLIKTAARMHLKALKDDGDTIPEPTTIVDYIDVA